MSHSDSKDRQLASQSFGNDAVIAHSKSPESGEFARECCSRKWLLGKSMNKCQALRSVGCLIP